MANFFPTNIQKLFSVVLVILLATELVNSHKSVSFNITNFKNAAITVQGSAEISASGVLELNDPNDPEVFVGRVLYATPVPIWDRSTGNVASFITTFTFIVEDVGRWPPADGLAFFLAPTNHTQIPDNSDGGKLGLVDGNSHFNQFVGVEFDSFINEWDPDYSHIGIDVNSLISLKTTPWKRVNGEVVNVSIAYDSNSKTLSVFLPDNNGQLSTVAQVVVDFKDVLPETVIIGFSASNSIDYRQHHIIKSWSFHSTFKTTPKKTLRITSSNDISSYVA
ncbi:hypothetical protein TSUD_37800 [Trifolium subterraneum]|uniref:Legume lectin domain-containing protein n=1 Tax=Trifolium subterraneum TaxID=3900 RepID=A0A2Z6LMB3_TRISU|nr:hypothetical protein TSUD_37800 [Trifolium subterraneum]